MQLQALLKLRNRKVDLALREVERCRAVLRERIEAEQRVQRRLDAVIRAQEQLALRLRVLADAGALDVASLHDSYRRRDLLAQQRAEIALELVRARQETEAARKEVAVAVQAYRLLLAKRDGAQDQDDAWRHRLRVMDEQRVELETQETAAIRYAAQENAR
jgi:hypothetical protein